MKNLSKIAAAIAVIGCGMSSAMAQMASPSGYPVGYNPSLYIMPSIEGIDPDNRFDSHNGGGVGLRIGGAIAPSWDLQFGPTFTRSQQAGVKYNQNDLSLDALYLFSRDSFRPFLMAGLGAEYDKIGGFDIPNGNSRTSPYIGAGLGFQYEFNDQWGMQADIRRNHSYIKGDDFGFDRANTNLVTIGLTYYFDKPAPPPMARVEPAPMPAPAPVAPPPPPPPPARFERVTLSATELFAFDSAELRMPQTKLDQIAAALSTNTTINDVVVEGYTDRIGSEKYNLRLSQRRADAVRNYLVSKGIAASRLTAVGKGKADPVVECTDKKMSDLIKCLEPNRRVQVEQITVERRVN